MLPIKKIKILTSKRRFKSCETNCRYIASSNLSRKCLELFNTLQLNRQNNIKITQKISPKTFLMQVSALYAKIKHQVCKKNSTNNWLQLKKDAGCVIKNKRQRKKPRLISCLDISFCYYFLTFLEKRGDLFLNDQIAGLELSLLSCS